MQMRQNEETVIFRTQRAPLKISNNHGRKLTFLCFLQQISQCAAGSATSALSP